VKIFFSKTTLFRWLKFKYIQICEMGPSYKRYQNTWVIQVFKEIFNGNLMMMTLKNKKLHFNDIEEIRGFMIIYKILTPFTMT
jgi:hypothetical protein